MCARNVCQYRTRSRNHVQQIFDFFGGCRTTRQADPTIDNVIYLRYAMALRFISGKSICVAARALVSHRITKPWHQMIDGVRKHVHYKESKRERKKKNHAASPLLLHTEQLTTPCHCRPDTSSQFGIFVIFANGKLVAQNMVRLISSA